MRDPLLQDARGDAAVPLTDHVHPGQPQETRLYIALGPAGACKVGTCAHCVIEEEGRPERAWDADGDHDLDFDRDTLFAHLADLGIVFTDRRAYICP
ncbi:MAG TPA: hypothetical protein VFV38_17085 [Ktedonobacteraceae bacterium]|nr:hypothetical protein [Ktedonobacteraceae bacterium]